MAISTSLLDKYTRGKAMPSQSDEADIFAVSRIRLVLALSAFLVAVVDYLGPIRANLAEVLVLAAYAAACAAAWVYTRRRFRWTQGKVMHRLDAAMCAAMVAAGGQSDVFPLVFLFFAIVVASLRYGLDEGARVTIVAVMLYCAAIIATTAGAAEPRVFLRAAVLLVFGRAIAELGERHIQAARRDALLRDLNQVANPRFGIDRTMTAALERTRAFFQAHSCFIVVEDNETGRFTVREVRRDGPLVSPVDPLNADLARAMLPEPRTHVLLYVSRWNRWVGTAGTSISHSGGPGCWMYHGGPILKDLGGLLEAGSFISAPVLFGRGKGRIYVTARTRHLDRADALLLARIAGQELNAIDRIDLLDRIATDSAVIERKKIALDLHDTAIQSYIGLQLGLAALCRKVDPCDPLSDDVRKLAALAGVVVGQLRDFSQSARGSISATGEPILLSALRRQAAQAMISYGVDIRIDIEGSPEFGDRLTAEVLQIVREGISNVCRHTAAKRAGVLLRCSASLLRIEINNEFGGEQPPSFRPRSISERAAALGGAAFVHQSGTNHTAVCVEIPI